MSLKERFDKYEDEYLKFDRIEHPNSRRPDIHAFLLLDALASTDNYTDMVSGADHDVIYLDVAPEKLERTAIDEQIRDLVRCGVMYDEHFDCLSMFV